MHYYVAYFIQQLYSSQRISVALSQEWWTLKEAFRLILDGREWGMDEWMDRGEARRNNIVSAGGTWNMYSWAMNAAR